jgi:arsenate reductase
VLRFDLFFLLLRPSMAEKTYNVLFICTGNSARSIMAEALMNHAGHGRFKAFSAGSHPTGKVNPLALEALAWLHLPTEGYRSKSWDEFAQPDSPRLDFVLTVCDNAAGEVCPVWPGQPMSAHWGVPDPAAAEGSEEEKLRHFHDAALTLKRRIELMLALPLARLDAMSLRNELHDIGKTGKTAAQ